MRECLQAFPEICRQKYGTEFNLGSIEDKVRHLRCRTPLTYEDLQYFESPEHWWFQKFWVFPPQKLIEPALKKATFDFWNLPDSDETETIRKLLYIFKSIELVSIILRFIRPEHYSIYSSPIQHMLDIRHGRDLIETYLTYISNMREIRKHYDLARVADADMALWVLHEKCFGQYQDNVIARAYQEDDFILQMRANNLVAPIADLSEARLAKALIAVKPDIAVLIACHYFEILIRKLANRWHLSEADYRSSLDGIIDSLPNYGPVDAVRKALWKSLKSTRNQLIHCGQLPGPCECQLLLEEIKKLEAEINDADF